MSTQAVSAPVERGDYVTDGVRLLRVLAATDCGILLEDAVSFAVDTLDPGDLAALLADDAGSWRQV